MAGADSGRRPETIEKASGAFAGYTLVRLQLQTGRTHQLRIHCAHPDGMGRPIVGDELYGTREKDQHLMLHAAEIWFRHPVTNEEMHFSLAPDFLP